MKPGVLRSKKSSRFIWGRIKAKHRGWVFTPREFAALGSRTAIDQALSRLQRAGKIRRLARGIYEYPRVHPKIGILSPPPEAVAKAMAARTGSRILVSGPSALNLLGLSTQVPIQNLFLTEGPSKTVQIGRQTITLKHAAPSKLLGAGTEAGTILQAVRSYGQKRAGEIPVKLLAERIPAEVKSELRRLATLAPLWSQLVLQEIAG
jgi:predicted transcriptional regulator of viral defense system